MTATTNETKTEDLTKVITGECRLSFPNIFNPREAEAGKPSKYTALLLIPKTDTTTVQALKRAQRAAVIAAGVAVPEGRALPQGWKDTLRDGDEDKNPEEYPEFAGHYFLNVSSKYAPGLVDASLQKIVDQTALYAGCYVRVQVNAFAFQRDDGKGVSFGMRHIMKIRDGEPLVTVEKTEEVFADFAETPSGGDESGLL